jgi:hypothetical protein
MQSIRRAIPAAAAITSVALLAAGCGGSSPNTTSTNASSQQSGNPVTQAYRYAACMRDHGVSNFPDPQVSSSNGNTQIRMMAKGGSPNFKTAQEACKSIIPAPSNADLAAQAHQEQVRKQDELSFALCMRDHGISGFPDPGPGPQGQLSLAMIQAAGVDLTAPQVRTAALACVPAAHGILTRAAVEQATSGNPQTGSGATSQGTGTTP